MYDRAYDRSYKYQTPSLEESFKKNYVSAIRGSLAGKVAQAVMALVGIVGIKDDVEVLKTYESVIIRYSKHVPASVRLWMNAQLDTLRLVVEKIKAMVNDHSVLLFPTITYEEFVTAQDEQKETEAKTSSLDDTQEIPIPEFNIYGESGYLGEYFGGE